MGANLSAGGGGSRRGSRRRVRSGGMMNEINVTPMVDVMLVLLIVFMVAAPLLTVSVPLDLPKASAKASAEEKPPLTISVKKTGEIFIMETQIAANELVSKLQAIAKNGVEERIFVRGDAEASYQMIMEVISQVKLGGFNKVALLATEKQGK
jgi:biopolymer transport protein TolR